MMRINSPEGGIKSLAESMYPSLKELTIYDYKTGDISAFSHCKLISLEVESEISFDDTPFSFISASEFLNFDLQLLDLGVSLTDYEYMNQLDSLEQISVLYNDYTDLHFDEWLLEIPNLTQFRVTETFPENGLSEEDREFLETIEEETGIQVIFNN
jgi:hypothetical protein